MCERKTANAMEEATKLREARGIRGDLNKHIGTVKVKLRVDQCYGWPWSKDQSPSHTPGPFDFASVVAFIAAPVRPSETDNPEVHSNIRQLAHRQVSKK